MSHICTFNRAWVGDCGNPVEKKGDFCKEHACRKCSSCGEKATRECDATMGLVCGFPLCDNCQHRLTKDGVNAAQGKTHVKKTEQEHKPWYMQEEL